MADDYYFDDDEFTETAPSANSAERSGASGGRRSSSSPGRSSSRGSRSDSGRSRASGRSSGSRRREREYFEEEYLDYAAERMEREKRSSGQRRQKAADPGQRQSGRKKKRSRGLPAAAVVVIMLVLAALIGCFGWLIWQDRYGYSRERTDLAAYMGVEGGSDTVVFLQDEKSDYRAHVIDGTVYLPYDTVTELLNSRFYFSETDGTVMYCLADDILTTEVGTDTWTSDKGSSGTEGYLLSRWDGNVLYLALPFVRQHTNFEYELYTDPNRLQLFTDWSEPVRMATVTKNTAVRVSGGVKSEILSDLAKGERVVILEEMQTWSKIKTEDCVIGYVENKRLDMDAEETYRTAVNDVQETSLATLQLNGKVNMGWHNIGGTEGNITFADYTANTREMNVISPTWYPIQNESGDIASYATQDYVDAAHAKGMQVWPAVDNFNWQGVDHNAFLRTRETRKHLIDQLMSQQAQYGFDGINVDFEQVDAAYGEDLVEFFRELSVACHERGIVLSIDNYVTYDFNDYYNMSEQAFFADYVVIMGYDEHYAGSTEAGSVASIDYVRYGIQRALQEVPASQLINGIPFYTRLWTTTDGSLSSQAISMIQQAEFISAHGVTPEWNSETAQNYVEFTEGSSTYQMWLEDADSVKAKLDVMQADGIAGVAEWKLSFETADIWDVIADYMNAQ